MNICNWILFLLLLLEYYIISRKIEDPPEKQYDVGSGFYAFQTKYNENKLRHNSVSQQDDVQR
jgi:hypothetical protein